MRLEADRHYWGGSTLKFADRRNPERPFFVLDDKAEGENIKKLTSGWATSDSPHDPGASQFGNDSSSLFFFELHQEHWYII